MAGKQAARRDGERQAGMPATVVLPPDCRMAALATLHTELTAVLPGGAVVLDGGHVERVDTAALQLLVLLRRELDGRGGTLAWRGSSEALNDAAGLLGLTRILELPAAGLA